RLEPARRKLPPLSRRAGPRARPLPRPAAAVPLPQPREAREQMTLPTSFPRSAVDLSLDAICSHNSVKAMHGFDLKPTTTERVSPKTFFRLRRKDKNNIKRITIVPPSFGKLDDDDFGSFIVEYRTPSYRVSK